VSVPTAAEMVKPVRPRVTVKVTVLAPSKGEPPTVTVQPVPVSDRVSAPAANKVRQGCFSGEPASYASGAEPEPPQATSSVAKQATAVH
jgi:hypothetical protein